MSPDLPPFTVAHLTTVDMSLRYLVAPQLLAVRDAGGRAVGISGPGPWVPEIEAMGVNHVALSSSTRGVSLASDLKAAYQLWRVLRTTDVTVLHTHNPKPGLYGRVLGRLAGIPLVVNTVHGLYATEDDPLMKRAIVYVLEAIASRFSDLELYQNSEDLELAVKKRIVSRKKAVLLGNGVDLERFDSNRADPAAVTAIRQEIGASDDSVVIGVVGRLVEEKGYPELFEAMEGLDPRHILVVIGPEDLDKADSLSSEVVNRARDLGIRFLGMRNDMVDLYAAMDMFVLPSHREGFPRAAMEAAAMGLPIIATDIRGCRQVVTNGENGFLVPVLDPAALRHAIEVLASDTAMRSRMGERSHHRSRAEFDEREVVRIVMDSYRRRLRELNLSHLIPPGVAPSTADFEIRPATKADAAFVANMHAHGLTTSLLPMLGRRFVKALYQALIGWPDAVVLVATDGDGPVGFIAGVRDTDEFYKHFVSRHGIRVGLVALPALVRPSVVRRALETLRYARGQSASFAELLSMAVAPRARRRGLATTLGRQLFDRLGSDEVKVVVAGDNPRAIAAYEEMGFVGDREIEVHAGERSQLLVWRA